MKLSRNKMLLVSFMLFSLFFGAGNLIFPPFLGQNAGSHTLPAMLGFLATAVVLPVLGVVVVARFDGSRPVRATGGQALRHRLHPADLSLHRARSWHPPCRLCSLRDGGGPLSAGECQYHRVDAGVLAGVLSGGSVAVCDTGKLVNRIGRFLTPVCLAGAAVFLFVCFLFRGGGRGPSDGL